MGVETKIRVTAPHDGLAAALPPGGRMRRPAVKALHRPVRLPDGRIQIGSNLYGIAAEISGPHTDATWRVLELFDGTRAVEEISRIVGAAFPDLGPDGVAAIIDQLTQAGFVEDAAAAVAPERQAEQAAPVVLEIRRLDRLETTFHHSGTSNA